MSQTTLEAPIALIPINAKPQPASLHYLQDVLNKGPPPRSAVLLRSTNQGRTIVLILILSLLTGLGSFSSDILTIELPTIVADIDLDRSLVLWPQAVYALTSSVLLLVAGSVADVLGAHTVLFTGNLLMGCFIIAYGLARTKNKLIAFRALQGVCMCLVSPTSVSILAKHLESGQRRNFAFGVRGLSLESSFLVGLVAVRGFVNTIGWRSV